ncbi:hypothetical protein R1sor_020984 [Riccia sorocarpa]|uniref:Uncharacterized protein n=1 Tax=Riccia sorocarpa TaxID=122646 RepID=A0ABD3GFQ9_9MARC
MGLKHGLILKQSVYRLNSLTVITVCVISRELTSAAPLTVTELCNYATGVKMPAKVLSDSNLQVLIEVVVLTPGVVKAGHEPPAEDEEELRAMLLRGVAKPPPEEDVGGSLLVEEQRKVVVEARTDEAVLFVEILLTGPMPARQGPIHRDNTVKCFNHSNRETNLFGT